MKAFLMLIAVALFTGGSLFSQNTTITDLSTHSADASAVLDVYSTTLGMLVPRLGTAPSTPANGLSYYSISSNSFFYNAGSSGSPSWTELSYGNLWSRSGTNTYLTNTTDKVGIGISGPVTLLHISDGAGTNSPQLLIENASATSDASERFSITTIRDYSLGIYFDNGATSDHNFKICNTTKLTGPGYNNPNTMLEIHDENPLPGIIDFNHQSRARAYLSAPQSIPNSTWQPIDFDIINYDEHTEFTLAPPPSNPGGPPTAYFTATEEGYYQVNSRTEFFLGEDISSIYNVAYNAYVSIAIYKETSGTPPTWGMYSQGNNLQIGYSKLNALPEEREISLWHNNAPNVSDVVYLQAGEKIAIYAWQSAGFSLILITGTAKTYVSIHKVS